MNGQKAVILPCLYLLLSLKVWIIFRTFKLTVKSLLLSLVLVIKLQSLKHTPKFSVTSEMARSRDSNPYKSKYTMLKVSEQNFKCLSLLNVIVFSIHHHVFPLQNAFEEKIEIKQSRIKFGRDKVGLSRGSTC